MDTNQKQAADTLANRIEQKVERAVDAGLKKVTASHRSAIIVAVVILGVMIVGAAAWG